MANFNNFNGYTNPYANALDWGRRKTGLTYRDHIHLNYLGGEIFGRYIWDELKKIRPYPSYSTSDLIK